MSQPFQLWNGLVLITAEFSGPSGAAKATLIVDTGATTTTIDGDLLRSVGYDPDSSPDRAQMTTVSGSVAVPRLMLNRLTALDRHAIGFRVLAHSVPDFSDVHGLLGLDFFRGLTLTIDFKVGRITLA